MNPDKLALEFMRQAREARDRVEAARRDELHRAAVARRRKAKRGGRR